MPKTSSLWQNEAGCQYPGGRPVSQRGFDAYVKRFHEKTLDGLKWFTCGERVSRHFLYRKIKETRSTWRTYHFPHYHSQWNLLDKPTRQSERPWNLAWWSGMWKGLGSWLWRKVRELTTQVWRRCQKIEEKPDVSKSLHLFIAELRRLQHFWSNGPRTTSFNCKKWNSSLLQQIWRIQDIVLFIKRKDTHWSSESLLEKSLKRTT